MAKLFIYDNSDSELQAASAGKARIFNADSKEQVGVSSFSALASAVRKHKHLDELILFCHGYTGGISIGGDDYTLSDPEIAKAFAGRTTQIDAIRFEGCWVGQAPDQMVAFGKLFSAKTVSGFTWVSWSAIATIEVKKGVTAKQLGTMLKEYERWFAKGTPSMAQLAAQVGTKKILLEWYQVDLYEKRAPYDTPPGQKGTNFQKFSTQKYRLRQEAKQVSMKAASAKPASTNQSPFEYVTVTL